MWSRYHWLRWEFSGVNEVKTKMWALCSVVAKTPRIWQRSFQWRAVRKPDWSWIHTQLRHHYLQKDLSIARPLTSSSNTHTKVCTLLTHSYAHKHHLTHIHLTHIHHTHTICISAHTHTWHVLTLHSRRIRYPIYYAIWAFWDISALYTMHCWLTTPKVATDPAPNSSTHRDLRMTGVIGVRLCRARPPCDHLQLQERDCV